MKKLAHKYLCVKPAIERLFMFSYKNSSEINDNYDYDIRMVNYHKILLNVDFSQLSYFI